MLKPTTSATNVAALDRNARRIRFGLVLREACMRLVSSKEGRHTLPSPGLRWLSTSQYCHPAVRDHSAEPWAHHHRFSYGIRLISSVWLAWATSGSLSRG